MLIRAESQAIEVKGINEVYTCVHVYMEVHRHTGILQHNKTICASTEQ